MAQPAPAIDNNAVQAPLRQTIVDRIPPREAFVQASDRLVFLISNGPADHCGFLLVAVVAAAAVFRVMQTEQDAKLRAVCLNSCAYIDIRG